ncbi:isochorismatase family protein [Sphingomonas sp.]|uniref:isochorismatase family protein n=1 Tax=Sphingomonas sp. TaxID=28214 RepID=UPI0035C7F9DA
MASNVNPAPQQAAGAPADARSPAGARIEPNEVQILFVDLQTPLVSKSKTHPPDAIAQSAAALARVGAILEQPMLFSVVAGGDGASGLLPELQPFATPQTVLQRVPVSPFGDPAIVQALARNDRRTLMVVGYVAEVALLQTVLDALAAGYTVFCAVDATGSSSERGEAAAMRAMEAAGATPTSVRSFAFRLVEDFDTPPGKQVRAAFP